MLPMPSFEALQTLGFILGRPLMLNVDVEMHLSSKHNTFAVLVDGFLYHTLGTKSSSLPLCEWPEEPSNVWP